jgi:UDP-glucuronate 4-epimerase
LAVLITGGAGFIGSHLIDKLVERGEKVVCLDNFDPYYDPNLKRKNIKHHLSNKNFKLVEADVRDQKILRKIFEKNKIEKVVHLAAKVGVRPSIRDPLVYEDVNVRGTLNLLETCKEQKLENFVFGSSSSVYGDVKKLPAAEDDVLNPISPYGASKRTCELYCRTYSSLHDIPIVCLRFFTAYGPRQRPDMAIHKFTRLMSEDKEIEMYGDGSSKRDYTYIDDIVKGTLSALDRKFDFEIFNLGSSRSVELRHLISILEEKLGKKANIKRLPEQPGDVSTTCADISKARRLLGYDPKTSIGDGIENFVKWYKQSK